MSAPPALQAIDLVYRRDARRVFATLVRLLGDFDLAEEALHDAFSAALEQWPHQGVPENPSAWLVSTGRFKAIDSYALQAAISAVHAEAPHADQTDWGQIVGLYGELLRIQPTPVVALNMAVAVAMPAGCEQGIALVDDILKHATMQDYHLAHAARADMCRRLHRWEEARAGYQTALSLVQLEPERRHLERRLSEIGI